MSHKKTHEQFLIEARLTHGDKYEYTQRYIKALVEIEIKCKSCGNIFNQKPITHIRGHGCPLCNWNVAVSKIRKDFESFVDRSTRVHGSKYTYYKDLFFDRKTKCEIGCNQCKTIFMQDPNSHMCGSGCPSCCHNGVSGDKDGVVYKIALKGSSMQYVGITTTPIRVRLQRHVDAAKSRRSKSPLATAILKHGKDQFEICILQSAKAKDLPGLERFWIEQLNTMHPNGFNVAKPGKGLILKSETPIKTPTA